MLWHWIPLACKLTRPNINRTAYRPPLLLTAAPHIEMIPQLTIIRDCHLDGVNLLISRFEGASSTMYGIWRLKVNERFGGLWIEAHYTTYIVKSCHKVILVWWNTKLGHDILIGSFVHNSSIWQLKMVSCTVYQINYITYAHYCCQDSWTWK